MPVGITGSSASISYPTGNDIAQLDPVSQWVKDAPQGEERRSVARQIRDAQSTGKLEIKYKNITSLPPLPEGLSTLAITGCTELKSLPVLPDSLKELKIHIFRNFDISSFPNTLEKISIGGFKSIECFPKLPEGLLHFSVDGHYVPPLPEGLLTLSLTDCKGFSAKSELPGSLKQLNIRDCEHLEISSFPNNLETISIRGDNSHIRHIPKLPDGLLHFSVYNNFIPPLPEGLLTLSLHNCDSLSDLTCLPASLDELDISQCNNLPTLLDLPNGLKKLDLSYNSSIIDLAVPLPSSLHTLKINRCSSINFPTDLPSKLSHIELLSDTAKTWNIRPQDLPAHVNIVAGDAVKFDPDCLKLPSVTYFDTSTDAANHFQAGDVVYGKTHDRWQVFRMISKLNGLSEKDIVMQNTLTNSIWSKDAHWEFKSDDETKERVNDYDRALDFKKFIAQHDRYNVTDPVISASLDTKGFFAKTSKAGLEFQTKIREKPVIFCVDQLVDVIPEIVSKQGRHGIAITSHELRWIYRHRDDDKVKENVKFSLHGKLVSLDTVFSLPGWDKYQPKNATQMQNHLS